MLCFNKTSIQKPLLSNLFKDRANFYAIIPTELFPNIHNLLNKLAMALINSGREIFSGAIANASYFEK